MGRFLNKLFGRLDEEDYEDHSYEYEAEDAYQPDYGFEAHDPAERYRQAPERQPVSASRRMGSRVVDMKQAASSMAAASQHHVMIMEPADIETAQQVCDFVRGGRTVICNIEKIDSKVAQRVIDFITGASYALDGSVQPISSLIFVVAPRTTIIGEQEQEQSAQASASDYIRRANLYAR